MTKITGSNKIISSTGIILLFLLISLAYFYPQLEGKVLQQPDISHHMGMSKELVDYRKNTGEEAIWTGSMFSGMPGYMISTLYKGNLLKFVQGVLRGAFHPAAILFLYLIGFFILLRSLGIKKWLSVAGAVAFGFSSYFIIIIAAGHNTKAYAIGYLAPVVAGVLLAFKNKPLGGALLFTIALSLEIYVSHLQITYYGLILIFLFIIFQFIYLFRNNLIPKFLKTVLYLSVGTILAVGTNFSRLYTNWEYSHETIRGPSELTREGENKTSGLDKDYVVQWSYGIDETLTLLIPNFKGGASQINPGVDSESYRTMRQQGVQNLRQNIRAVSMYHGDQPGTSGPVYVGAIVVFLFILGLFVIKGPMKWWLLSATILSIILSWGGNIMWLTNILLDYLPLYNKFRAPSMILIVAELTMPLLGFIALNDIITGKAEKKTWLNGLKWSLIITGGLSLLFAILPGIAGDFSNVSDSARYPDWLINSVIADRKAMLRSDSFRSFLFITLAAGSLYLWHLQKIKTNLFIGILGVLVLVDLWSVDKRYLNNDNFETKKEVENPFPMMPVDQEIMKDPDLSYRVLPLQNPFQDARTSYYHKNVGGYHAAKLRRYQELIDHHLLPEMQEMVKKLQGGNNNFVSVFHSLPVINMLNTRYIIYDLNSAPIRNPNPLGNAWFVSEYKIVENADEEIDAMNDFNPSETAIIDQRFEKYVNSKKFNVDKNATIILTEYQPNYLKYSAKTVSEQLAVFSEIYYDKGWNAYIDGKKIPHFRVNYVLRALILPAGEHTVEFKFEPQSYYIGNRISLASSILLLLAILGYGFIELKKRKK
ncbi:MAG: YfhO family protein [Bacteroidales bacterium]|nr:YfhO family protein [Bacteroidales bacterium]